MSEVITCNCDCGFSWVHGTSGHHYCGGYYRQQIQELLRENLELKLSQDNVTAALGISGEGAHSKLVIEYVHGLVAENAAMLKLLTDVSDNHTEYFNESEDGMYADIPLDYVSEINMYVSRDVNAENPFERTDAAIAEIESVGAEKMFNLVEPAVRNFCNPEVTGFIISELESLAANLRAGRKG